MRTVIYVGLIAIADAINKDWHQGKHIGIYVTIFICAILWDMFDSGKN
jgi:hypothetical protein